MRYTVYAMTPSKLAWEVNTQEGNQKYLEFYEGTAMQGKVVLKASKP